MKAAERRTSDRKSTEAIEVTELTSLQHYRVIAKSAHIVDASATGILMHVNRKDLLPKELKENLSLQELLGQLMAMYLPQMNLDLDGRVTRADHIGKGVFEIAIQFSEDVPLYWRECLVDLLPTPGEMSAEEAD